MGDKSQLTSSKGILCRYFMHGACKKGESCPFSHNWVDQPSTVCTFYQRGICSFGDKCRYDHVKLQKPPFINPNSQYPGVTENPQQEYPINTQINNNSQANGWSSGSSSFLSNSEKTGGEGERENDREQNNSQRGTAPFHAPFSYPFSGRGGALPNLTPVGIPTSPGSSGGGGGGGGEYSHYNLPATLDSPYGPSPPPNAWWGGSGNWIMGGEFDEGLPEGAYEDEDDFPDDEFEDFQREAAEFSAKGAAIRQGLAGLSMNEQLNTSSVSVPSFSVPVPGPVPGPLPGPGSNFGSNTGFDSGSVFGPGSVQGSVSVAAPFYGSVPGSVTGSVTDFVPVSAPVTVPSYSVPVSQHSPQLIPAFSTNPTPSTSTSPSPSPSSHFAHVNNTTESPLSLSLPQNKLNAKALDFHVNSSSSSSSTWVRNNGVGTVVEDMEKGGSEEKGESGNALIESGLEKGRKPEDEPICPFAAAGQCPKGENCEQIHGDKCTSCGKSCLHPHRPKEREEHLRSCERNQRKISALQLSQEIECCVCLERVLSKPSPSERRFGVLSGCDHPFCLGCIRSWRHSSSSSTSSSTSSLGGGGRGGMDLDTVVRACPVCRVQSHYVTPSIVWYGSAKEKEEIIEAYKKKLNDIDCRYFDFGNGKCPFGTSCFYKHVYPDGRKEQVKLRHLGAADGSTVIVADVRLSDYLVPVMANRR